MRRANCQHAGMTGGEHGFHAGTCNKSRFAASFQYGDPLYNGANWPKTRTPPGSKTEGAGGRAVEVESRSQANVNAD